MVAFSIQHVSQNVACNSDEIISNMQNWELANRKLHMLMTIMLENWANYKVIRQFEWNCNIKY